MFYPLVYRVGVQMLPQLKAFIPLSCFEFRPLTWEVSYDS